MDDLAYKQFAELEKSHWWFAGRRQIFFALLNKYLPADQDLKIMDVGCGYGGMLDGLKRWGSVLGLEIDLDSARFCRSRGFPGICLGSGYHLPLQNASLDLITLFDTIEHIEDDARVVQECAAALKPGGHLMITVPAYQLLYADNDRIAHHQRRYRLSRLKTISRAAGLETRKGTYFNVLLFPAIFPAVLLFKALQAFRGPIPEDREGSTNLSYKYPRLLSFMLEKIFSFEKYLWTRVSAPFGHSIALIARKPGG